ncbi:ATP-dependent Clp protease proteolytic subunit [Herminiimonas sp. CN]|uniref:ATP-dependent Clp protease proteolytic subunit n=1 Tax=Herminiimonas sp. CN TaxID=1349818 RepID=UPI0012DC9293
MPGRCQARRERHHTSLHEGSTDQGFALYNFLRSLPIPLKTHNIGDVESIAVVVFLASTKRFTCPHSRFASCAELGIQRWLRRPCTIARVCFELGQ